MNALGINISTANVEIFGDFDVGEAENGNVNEYSIRFDTNGTIAVHISIDSVPIFGSPFLVEVAGI